MFETQIIQGREISNVELDQVRQLTGLRTGWSRRQLSQELCRLWDWRSCSGQMKDMAARSLLNKLAERGLIDLPARRPHRGGRHPLLIKPLESDWFGPIPISDDLKSLQPLQVHLIGVRQPEAQVFRSYLARHHYLGYRGAVGQNLQYLIRDRHRRDLACVLFGAAAWKVVCRDQWIGWNAIQRMRRLCRITNNSRFLILPWVRVSHLASHILAIVLRRLRSDWLVKYREPIDLVETFVEKDRFEGTCYRAANWMDIGQTKGRSRQDPHHTVQVAVKQIYVYPLNRHFRRELCGCDEK